MSSALKARLPSPFESHSDNFQQLAQIGVLKAPKHRALADSLAPEPPPPLLLPHRRMKAWCLLALLMVCGLMLLDLGKPVSPPPVYCTSGSTPTAPSLPLLVNLHRRGRQAREPESFRCQLEGGERGLQGTGADGEEEPHRKAPGQGPSKLSSEGRR